MRGTIRSRIIEVLSRENEPINGETLRRGLYGRQYRADQYARMVEELQTLTDEGQIAATTQTRTGRGHPKSGSRVIVFSLTETQS